MGLDTSHDCWHGPYSAFSRFRKALARAAGLPPLFLMEGFYSEPLILTLDRVPQSVRDSVSWKTEGLPIRWDCLKPDPLHALLHHSDCDGELPVKVLIPLAKRLEALVPILKAGGEENTRWAESAAQFARGCRAAARAREPVEFH
jgi:hypothetical protein